MKQLLVELDQWLQEYRADLYPKLNPPVTEQQLLELQHELGIPIPASLRALLSWRNGQPNDELSTFHPLTNEMFVSSAAMIQTMKIMKELVQHGDIDSTSWNAAWLPFMDNGGGNMSCVDARTGAVFSRDHETQECPQTHSSLEEWLAELVSELATNNFSEWDIVECRRAS